MAIQRRWSRALIPSILPPRAGTVEDPATQVCIARGVRRAFLLGDAPGDRSGYFTSAAG